MHTIVLLYDSLFSTFHSYFYHFVCLCSFTISNINTDLILDSEAIND